GVTPNPSYNYTAHTCGGTYCHGSLKNGNTTNAPVWNAPAGTGAACGTCHGTTSGGTTAQMALPKTAATGGDHPSFTQCSWCHNAVVDANTNIIDGTKHVDGQVALFQYSTSADCARCHGSGTNAAPPTDLAGNIARTSPGVGAHQIHVAGSTGGRTVPCNECHTVPTTLDYTGADGHLDPAGGSAELAFGTLSQKGTTGVIPNPAYTFNNRTCAGTYCHGSFANGNTTNAAVWNGSAGTGAECGTCHGNTSAATTPLKALPKTAANGGTHPNYTQCVMCHTGIVDANTVITDVSKHVDGQVALFQLSGPADCAHCHGSATNAAPPTDLSGNTATSARGVGVHQAHLVATSAKSVKCAECHTVPASLDYTGADGHLEGTALAEVAMADTLARLVTNAGASVPNPTYDATAQSCSSTYCHGTFKYGNASNVATWTNPATAACGTCHGNPATGSPLPSSPNLAQHNLGTSNNCQNCHTVSGEAAVATFDGSTWSITNAARHINGRKNTFTAETVF
ncbi:MAG: CxxxxCH/CxxCH domain-containing protein, partial [Bacteroidota bacterium]